jgi:hypothetical protein
MGSSLRDIPGAGGGRRRRGLGKVAGGPASTPWRPPPKIQDPGKGRRGAPALRFQGPRFRVDRFNLVLAGAFVALFVVGGFWLVRANRVSVSTGAFGDGDAVRTTEVDGLRVELTIEPHGQVEAATVRFEDEDVTDAVEQTDTGFVWTPPRTGLEEGSYELAVSVPKAVFGTTDWSMTFAVDDTPPVLRVEPPGSVGISEEVTVTGEVDEQVTLTAEGDPVAVDEDGRFSVTFPTPPAGAAHFQAEDPAGNRTRTRVPITVAPPSTRGAHLSVDGWNDEGVREGVLALLDAGEIDTVVLDVKDECGVVTYDSEVDLAAQVGAEDARLDLQGAIDTVHEHDGQVIARVVTFRDPMLARWGWANGHPDWVLQDGARDPWPIYGDGEGCEAADNAPTIVGGFTNPANQAVWDYNTAIAVEAAALGADNVLLDDVRRPDGDLTAMLADGLQGGYADALTTFLTQARQAVRDEGAYLGTSVTGLSVRDPALYAQELGRFAEGVDYLAPEVYPEAYSSGFFNLPDPQAAPGAAVQGAVQAARDQLGDTVVPIVPWLQDYSSAIPYGLPELQAQVDGAAAAGACSWILRDPEFTYTSGVRPAC